VSSLDCTCRLLIGLLTISLLAELAITAGHILTTVLTSDSGQAADALRSSDVIFLILSMLATCCTFGVKCAPLQCFHPKFLMKWRYDSKAFVASSQHMQQCICGIGLPYVAALTSWLHMQHGGGEDRLESNGAWNASIHCERAAQEQPFLWFWSCN
jgi:hypothetical protein